MKVTLGALKKSFGEIFTKEDNVWLYERVAVSACWDAVIKYVVLDPLLAVLLLAADAMSRVEGPVCFDKFITTDTCDPLQSINILSIVPASIKVNF